MTKPQLLNLQQTVAQSWESEYKARSRCTALNESSGTAFTASQVSGLNEVAFVKNFPCIM